MPFQLPISSPYPFEKDKGIGFGSFYCGCTQIFYLMCQKIFSKYSFDMGKFFKKRFNCVHLLMLMLVSS
jgi:hypothetical protein